MNFVNKYQTKEERRAKYHFVLALTHSSKLAYQFRDFRWKTIIEQVCILLNKWSVNN